MLKRRIYGYKPVKILCSSKARKKLLSFFLFLAVVSFSVGLNAFLFSTTKAADVTWDGGGGADLDWCTDANWSTDAEPTINDSVTISRALVTEVLTSGCVTEGHTVDFSSLTVGGGLANQNSLTIEANIGSGSRNITIGTDGTIIQKNTTTQVIGGTLLIESGGILTHADNNDSHVYEVDFQAVTITIAGSVNVNAKGFSGGASSGDAKGTGPGLFDALARDGSGGGHSGAGGTTTNMAGGTAYCNNNNPVTLGSGGGGSFSQVGGDGGGLVRLKATTSFGLTGSITANGSDVVAGDPNEDAGGGAGGGVKLDAPTVNISSGRINVDGGDSVAGTLQGGGGGGGCVFINYSTAYTFNETTVTSTSNGLGFTNGGAGSYLSNALPSVIEVTTEAQSSANFVSSTVTVADSDNNSTSLTVEYSTDEATWAMATLGVVTPSEGAITTSTGSITGIDTNLDGSVNLSIEWNIGADLVNTDDTTVYLRFVPSDSLGSGTTVTSRSFTVDTKNPTAPGALTVSTTSTTSVDPKFGSATVDNGFLEYKIFYSNSTPVTTANSSLTSSTDANLGLINFGGANTTTVSGLTANTLYYANIWAYDVWGHTASSTSEINFYTLASVPSGVTAVVDSKTQITLSWSGNGTEYYAQNTTAGTNSGWLTGTSYAFSGLTAGTSYSFAVKARNGNSIETALSGSVSATTQSDGGGGAPPVIPGGGGGDPPPIECEGQDCEPKKPTGQVGGYVLINDDSSKTTVASVNLNLYFTKFVSTYAVAEANSQLVCDFSGKSFQDIGSNSVFNDNYQTKVVPFTLSTGFGSKKVCVKYRGSIDGGKSFVDYSAFDTILFEEVNKPVEPLPDSKPIKPEVPEKPIPKDPIENPPKNPIPTQPEVPSSNPPSNPTTPGLGDKPVSPSQGGSSDGTPILPSSDAVFGVKETAVGFPSALKETLGIVNFVAVEPAVKAIKKVIDNPKVEKVNEVAIAPAIIIAGAANVAIGFNATQLLLTLRYIFSQPLLLLRLRKRKSWGVIYNALNKMPVDLAVIRLVDESTGRIVQSQVTDAQGRYLLNVEPGEYHLEVDKVGFSGFSKLLTDKEEDAKFIHLYHGGKFHVTETETETVLNYNIPLDPADEVKGNNLIIREYTKKATQNIICIIGLVASVASFIISPKLIIFAFILLHLLFYWLFYRFSHRKVTAGSFGSVTEIIMEEPISKAVVRVFDSMYNKLVDTTVTDRKGRYAVLVGPSKYYTTYEKDGFEKKQSEVLDFSSEKTNGMGGLINRDEELKKIDK